MKERHDVWVRDSRRNEWNEGIVLAQTGPNSYRIKTGKDRQRYHADQIRTRIHDQESPKKETVDEEPEK
ncbi:hypothetical protein ACOME3_009046 [Neoechinorhynchus agilis]